MDVNERNNWGFWKIATIIMLFCNLCMFLYLLTKFNLLGGIRDATNSIDSPIVFSLTLLQTFIALGAFAGFWIIRSSAKDAARDEAKETVGQYVKTSEFESALRKELLSPDIQSIINRTAVSWMHDPIYTEEEAEADSNLVIAAGEENGGEDE